jgi:hypothetical protein
MSNAFALINSTAVDGCSGTTTAVPSTLGRLSHPLSEVTGASDLDDWHRFARSPTPRRSPLFYLSPGTL